MSTTVARRSTSLGFGLEATLFDCVLLTPVPSLGTVGVDFDLSTLPPDAAGVG